MTRILSIYAVGFFLTLKAVCADSLTISPIAFSIHAYSIDKVTREEMPNKITDNGAVAMHPGLSLIYKTEYMQYGVNYIRDCYGNHAGSAMLGPKIDFLTYFSAGGVAGLYVRENPNSNRNKLKTRFLGNDMPITGTVGGVDFIPLAAATLSAKVPITETISAETNIISNGFLTHTTFGLRLDF